MAYEVNALGTYVAENKDIILKDIVFGGVYGNTVPLMTKELGVKGTAKINPSTIEAVLQDVNGACGFEARGDLNITMKVEGYIETTNDTDGFKQWLSENPTTVVYELANPYYEEIEPTQEDLIITSVKEGDLHIDTIVPISSKVTYNVNVQLLTDFEQSIVEQVQATQTTDLQSILDEEIDN